MIRPPFMARVAAGVAVTAYEETLKLPSTALALPMTTVSQVLQTTMRVQQSMTSLAIKGDRLFEILGAPSEENPTWAVFDEDEVPSTSPVNNGAEPSEATGSSEAPGRFALYSMPPAVDSEPAATDPVPAKKAAQKAARPGSAASKASKAAGSAKPTESAPAPELPEIADYLDYGSLTLAQLRARLRTLSVEDLTALLDYENATRARAPFVTMLSNRITTASAR
ncbi:MAG: lipid droplet-associated protein [Rhodococcus sp. (in: high G+C Gram-positive bacteria)]|uniref:lipid droplet-associated protein n=1 Tax=Rhodococcus sp. TaxID=1831 RepID=UPI003BB638C7